MEDTDPFRRNAEYLEDGTIEFIRPDQYAEALRLHADETRLNGAPEGFTVPRFNIPEAWALDLDKTLINNDTCMQRLFMACAFAGMEDVEGFRASVAERQAEVEGSVPRQSFEPLTMVQERLMPDGVKTDQYRTFERGFILNGPDVFYEDAKRFLRLLQWSDIPHIIPTKGVNPEWQYLKLAAGHYVVGQKVIDHPYKGIEVSQLRGSDGKFHLYVASMGEAAYSADIMNVAEDKPEGFEGLPDDCGGVLIRRGAANPSQSGAVPERIRVISSFDELTVNEVGQVVLKADGMPEPPMRYQRRLELVQTMRGRKFDELNFAVYLPAAGEGWRSNSLVA